MADEKPPNPSQTIPAGAFTAEAMSSPPVPLDPSNKTVPLPAGALSDLTYVLSGPHAFICDECQFFYKKPLLLTRAFGRCGWCGLKGFLQVGRTGRNTREKMQLLESGLVFTFVIIVLLVCIFQDWSLLLSSFKNWGLKR